MHIAEAVEKRLAGVRADAECLEAAKRMLEACRLSRDEGVLSLEGFINDTSFPSRRILGAGRAGKMPPCRVVGNAS